MDEPVGQRYTLLYIAALNDKLDRRRLTDRAVHYDIPDEVEDLVRYVDERGNVEESNLDLPTWSEFSRIANEYEVEI